MKNLRCGKFPPMTSYPFCDVVVRSDDAFMPNGNTVTYLSSIKLLFGSISAVCLVTISGLPQSQIRLL